MNMQLPVKMLFFDAGPIISLIMSRLGWLLPLLKQQFKGEFYITPAVKHELVDRPLTIRRFEFEALEVMKLIREKILAVYQEVPQTKVKDLSAWANNSFNIAGQPLKIVQEGEMESIVCSLKEKAALVIDERTLRMLIEDCARVQDLLENRFQKKVTSSDGPLKQFHQAVKGVSVIRSVELVGVAYGLGMLDAYLPQTKVGRNAGNDVLIEAVLWATKFNGCAVTEHELSEIKQQLLKK